MAWLALDRGVKAGNPSHGGGPSARWRMVRDAIHEAVCREGFDPELGSFVQYYGAKQLDASLLMIPLVGFLPPGDPRVRGPGEGVERHRLGDGFVQPSPTESSVDGPSVG